MPRHNQARLNTFISQGRHDLTTESWAPEPPLGSLSAAAYRTAHRYLSSSGTDVLVQRTAHHLPTDLPNLRCNLPAACLLCC